MSPRTINDEKLISLLIENGKISSEKDSVSCRVCKRKINVNEIAAIAIGDNDIYIACENINCLEKIGENGNNE